MVKRFSLNLGLVLMIAFLWLPHAAEAIVRPSDLSQKELLEVERLLATEVKADLSAHFEETLRSVSHAAGGGDPTLGGVLIGDPMSPETRAVLAKGLYQVLGASLLRQGIHLSEAKFNSVVGKILDYSTRMGVFPSALTVGYMGRIQAGVGGSAGSQFNFYFDKGKMVTSEYSIFGAHVGFAEMTKIQFYISFCFGTCFGGDAAGWYVGLDGSATAGGGAGLFVEGGVDVTDLIKASFLGTAYSARDLYQAKAIYVGAGFDVGQGIGVSGDVFYYTHDFDLLLMDAHQKPDSKVFSKIKL